MTVRSPMTVGGSLTVGGPMTSRVPMTQGVPMTPGETRGKTLSGLRQARKDMMSAEWLARVNDLPEAERTAAAMAMLDVCSAVRRLENTRVASIRKELADNGKELERGRRALERARERLHRIEAYLKAVTTLVATVAKVVKR